MNPLLGALLKELQDDDSAKRELAEILRPYLHVGADDGDRRLLNAGEMAELVQVHPDTLVRWARDGRIPARKVGREWRFRPADMPTSAATGRGGAARTRVAAADRVGRSTASSVTAIRGR